MNLPDWLAIEELPTGTFGDAPPHRNAPRPQREVKPDPRALEHCADLLKALDTSDRATRRHLHAVPDTHAA